jgi:hypothetical protein
LPLPFSQLVTVGGLTPSNFANYEVFIPNRLRSLVTAAAVGVKAFLLFLIGFFSNSTCFSMGFYRLFHVDTKDIGKISPCQPASFSFSGCCCLNIQLRGNQFFMINTTSVLIFSTFRLSQLFVDRAPTLFSHDLFDPLQRGIVPV